jgi:hypothetical protein
MFLPPLPPQSGIAGQDITPADLLFRLRLSQVFSGFLPGCFQQSRGKFELTWSSRGAEAFSRRLPPGDPEPSAHALQ